MIQADNLKDLIRYRLAQANSAIKEAQVMIDNDMLSSEG